ncbi:MAG TPA: NAD(P)H-dependent oxidoreductase subunit E [Gemmatimonadales bacterium]|nr:NAD(P)H-dependent oxidoreductase subunit E [Gemmatimonadales bacterium]
MDLHLLDAEPTAEERDAVDAFLGPPTSGWEGGERDPERDAHTAFGGHAARARRHLLLPTFHAVQSRMGWISEGALNYVCKRLSVPPADAYGVATFYALLSTVPRPKRVLHVCDDIACRCKGADKLCEELERRVGPPYPHGPAGDHTEIPANAGVWLRSPCLGLCDQAPAALLTIAGDAPVERLFGELDAAKAARVVGGDLAPSTTPHPRLPQTGAPELRLLRRVNIVDPTSLDDYRSRGGYDALRLALDLGPEGIIREVTDAKLLGRGGAAFPTGRKWDAVARQPVRPHYVICNADESEPGTFKDRVIMEGDPFSVIEAMTIAGYATSAERGFIYVRGEYPLAIERLQGAIDSARARGLLGDDVMGQGFRFDIEIRKGGGAYICGEETAIFNSIEGFRGEPRNKPPFPVQSGVFSKPTVINNVETLANVPEIIRLGGPAYAKLGTEGSTGPRVFCLSGCVTRPGVYEVESGATLRQLYDMAGGVAPGRTLQAVLLGGAAGVFVRPDELDMPLTFEGARAAQATLGSGVIMVFDDTIDLVPILLRMAAFFRDESCGQCVPCRVGTVRQEEALHRIHVKQTRGGLAAELALLAEVGLAMKDASICGLGQTAYSAVESAVTRLKLFDGATAR